MKNVTLSFFGNQIFFDIIGELEFFSKFKIKFYNDSQKKLVDFVDKKNLIIFFVTENNISSYNSLLDKNLPILVITNSKNYLKLKKSQFIENIEPPFKILDLEKKNYFTLG